MNEQRRISFKLTVSADGYGVWLNNHDNLKLSEVEESIVTTIIEGLKEQLTEKVQLQLAKMLIELADVLITEFFGKIVSKKI